MRASVTASFVVFAVATAAVAIGARQARDAGIQSPSMAVSPGTAVLSGTLMTDTATPRPVRRAVVRLSGAGPSARVAGTDDDGRFVFTALPAGSFSLSATKIGYVPAFYGSKRPGRGPGVPIAIADGQRLAVTLGMAPGAVITGTITDPSGNPVPTVSVLAVELRPSAATATPSARVTTDDRGVYRIFGLAPGDYLVSALPRVGAGRSGAPTDVLAVTDAEVQWARSIGTSGAFGPGPVGAQAMPPSGRPVTYSPVYYPGTMDIGAASTVSVAAGEERADIGFSLRIVATASIAGTLVDQNGQAFTTAASVSFYPRRTGQPAIGDALTSSGALALPRAVVSAPSFSIAGVTPGDYTLVARSGSTGRATVAAPAAADPLWSVTDLTVDGQDQTGLVLRLLPGMRVSGSIAFERASLPAPTDVRGLDLSMVAVSSLVGAPAAPKAVVDQTGAFRFASVVPGTYALKPIPPAAPAGGYWTVKSAMLNGRDLADVPLDVKPGEDVSGIVITFTDRGSEISGTFVDASGRPLTRYSIVVFTTDRSLWLPGARRIRSTTPATDGTFRITGLPAGDYGIAAAEDVEAFDLADPAFLSQLLAAAYRLTVADGEKKVQNLRVGG